ncbi:MAG: hypothetical protein L3J78_02895, partial [Thermoplasmata archaeon]|nr:hypothetical protein [Thermoplasmata archaeon]
GWGDPEAPKNSWDSLLVSLIVLAALPFLLEFAGHRWTKYVAPRLPKIPWPWRRAPRKPKESIGPPDDPLAFEELDAEEPSDPQEP